MTSGRSTERRAQADLREALAALKRARHQLSETLEDVERLLQAVEVLREREQEHGERPSRFEDGTGHPAPMT